MLKRIAACLTLVLLLPWTAKAEFRVPGPADMDDAAAARVLANGSMDRSPVLDAALSLLEEGNPFLTRYNLLTGADIRPRLTYGVPYLFGGQTASHVFYHEAEDEYVVQSGWLDSLYYRADVLYLYGFDCAGYMKWVWWEAGLQKWPGIDPLLQNGDAQLYNSDDRPMPAWKETAAALRVGDTLALRRSGRHTALYIGTLRQFGYTEAEAPELAAYLDWPLVIHSTVNASVAQRFSYLMALEESPRRYRLATVTDGGVCVSLLGPALQDVPLHVFQQKQDTYYFLLPDGTWLTVLPWEDVGRYCWVRPQSSALPSQP